MVKIQKFSSALKKKFNPTKNKNDFHSFKGLIKASYDTNIKKVGDAVRDENLSGKRVSVFKNATDHKTYVVHRGTHSMKDWATDVGMFLGMENTNRFKHSKKVQKNAEKKYGKENVITLGHSLGGRLAEKMGGRSSQIVTYNKAVTPGSVLATFGKPLPKKQTDIRTKLDVVSAMSKLQRMQNKTVEASTKTFNVIKAHSGDALKFNKLQT